MWTHQFGTSLDAYAKAVYVDSDGVYVAGYTDGTFPGQINAGAYDAYATAYDADVNMLWIKQFGTDKDDYAKGIFANSAGVYVAGSTKGAFTARKSSSASDAFIAKLITK